MDLEVRGGSVMFPVRTKRSSTLGGGFKKAQYSARSSQFVRKPAVPRCRTPEATTDVPASARADRVAALERELEAVKAQLQEQTTSSSDRSPATLSESLQDHVILLAASRDESFEQIEARFLREKRAAATASAPPTSPTKRVKSVDALPALSHFSQRRKQTTRGEAHNKTVQGLAQRKPEGAGVFTDEDLSSPVQHDALEAPGTPRVVIDRFLLTTIEDIFREIETKEGLRAEGRVPPGMARVNSIVDQLELALGASLSEVVRICPQQGRMTLQNALADIQTHPDAFINWEMLHQYLTSGYAPPKPVPRPASPKNKSPSPTHRRSPTNKKSDDFLTLPRSCSPKQKMVASPKSFMKTENKREKNAPPPFQAPLSTGKRALWRRNQSPTRQGSAFVEKAIIALRQGFADEFENLENAYRQIVRFYPSGEITGEGWIDWLELFPRLKPFLVNKTAVRVFNFFDPHFTDRVQIDELLGVNKVEVVAETSPRDIADTFGQPDNTMESRTATDAGITDGAKDGAKDVNNAPKDVKFNAWVHETPPAKMVEMPLIEAKHWQMLKSIFEGMDVNSVDVLSAEMYVKEARSRMPEWLDSTIYWKDDANLDGPGPVPTTLGQALSFLEKMGGFISWAEARRLMEAAPKKRKPRIEEFMKVDIGKKPFEANKWMVHEMKVRKNEFLSQLGTKDQLMQELHKNRIAETTATWSEILPDIARGKDLIRWSDVLEIVKFRNANPRAVDPTYAVDRTNLDKPVVAISNGVLTTMTAKDDAAPPPENAADDTKDEARAMLAKAEYYIGGSTPVLITKTKGGDTLLMACDAKKGEVQQQKSVGFATVAEATADARTSTDEMQQMRDGAVESGRRTATGRTSAKARGEDVNAIMGQDREAALDELQAKFELTRWKKERMTKDVPLAAPPLIAPVITTIGADLDDMIPPDSTPAPPPDIGDILPDAQPRIKHRFLQDDPVPSAYDPFNYERPTSNTNAVGWAHFARPAADKTVNSPAPAAVAAAVSSSAGRPPLPPDVLQRHARMAAEAVNCCSDEAAYAMTDNFTAETLMTLRSQSVPVQVEPISMGSTSLRVQVDRDFATCTSRELETMRQQIEVLLGCRGVVLKSVKAGSVILELEVPEEVGVSLNSLTRRQVADALSYEVLSLRVGNKEMPQDMRPLTNEELVEEEYKYRILTRAGARPQSASPMWTPTNHVTVPVGFKFLTNSCHWAHKHQKRIRERRFTEDQDTRDMDNKSRVFKATPCPTHVSVPRFSQMLAAEDLRRGFVRASSSVSGKNTKNGEEKFHQFRARPVPWHVQAPLYEQIVLAKESKRHADINMRSKEQLRMSTLPPRLELMKDSLMNQTWHPRKDVLLRTEAENAARRHSLSPRDEQAPIWKPAGVTPLHCVEEKWHSATLMSPRSDGQQQQHIREANRLSARRVATSSRSPGRSTRAYATKEVPNFAAKHAKFQRTIDKAKVDNRSLTKPAPFAFHAPSRHRATRAIGTEPADDPTLDFRWHKKNKRPKEGPTLGYSRPQLDLPLSVLPRTTKKTLMAQRAVQNRIRDLRAKEQVTPEPTAVDIDSEVAHRVKGQLRAGSSHVESVEKKITDKRDTQMQFERRWKRELGKIEQAVSRRPLLMERQGIESVKERARQRALLRVRGALETQGVAVDAHFNDDELDVLDKA
eukprot:GEMP01001200.1.p1 GENE.GEMP01001200.1~~GEMP01001200.1.p1  ORF type:complete len:1668 (+),score=435.58 GEMP01001200.1:83-5086(+)